MENSSQITRAIEVVYCHSDNDKDRYLRDELEKHLMTMQREDIITTWHEDKIGAGEEWQSEIDKHIDTARIILPLISSDFVSSDKSYESELARAIKRYKSSLELYVIPIILRPVDWQHIKFDSETLGDADDITITLSDMYVLPENQKPVTLWDNYDRAFINITNNIRKYAKVIWTRDHLAVDDAYKQLKQELAAGEWHKANKTTKYLVFKISSQEQTGFLSQEIIKKIPSRDVRVIDNLWRKYSNKRFGFSIQKKLLQQNNYQDFLTQIGWYINDSWLKDEELDFTINAPQGHLPYCGESFWKAEPSPPPDSPTIPYYRIPNYRYQYKYPPNYYWWRSEQQRKFQEKLSVKNKLQQQLYSPSSKNLLSNQIANKYLANNRSGADAGKALVGVLALATRALPLAIGITVVATGIYAGVKMYNNHQKEKDKQEKENEIKEKINGLLSHLNSWTV
ncbi:MAG: TIR domain-containing protein [Okeania sp. SIO1H6]|nr:TIR domain-containing protein [Okeania sp. SIO1H6]